MNANATGDWPAWLSSLEDELEDAINRCPGDSVVFAKRAANKDVSIAVVARSELNAYVERELVIFEREAGAALNVAEQVAQLLDPTLGPLVRVVMTADQAAGGPIGMFPFTPKRGVALA